MQHPTRDLAHLTLMERVALTRLRRFERLAAVADRSDSPLWRRLAGHAAAGAMRDCILLGLAPETRDRATHARAA